MIWIILGCVGIFLAMWAFFTSCSGDWLDGLVSTLGVVLVIACVAAINHGASQL